RPEGHVAPWSVLVPPTPARLRDEGLDRIERERAVVPDGERQVARGEGVAGADRTAVRVIDQQAAQPDDHARSQVTGRAGGLAIATNTYPWGTFASRDGVAFDARSDDVMAAMASAGLSGYEPAFTEVAELDGLGPRLRAHGLQMPSLYVNSTLHDDSAAASIE